jgi:hypothetical protein
MGRPAGPEARVLWSAPREIVAWGMMLLLQYARAVSFRPTLRVVWTGEPTAETYRVMAIGAQSLPMLVGFASLAAAWLLVSVGMERQGARL